MRCTFTALNRESEVLKRLHIKLEVKISWYCKLKQIDPKKMAALHEIELMNGWR